MQDETKAREVIQADRDAAMARDVSVGYTARTRAKVLRGDKDEDTLVLAFARHRLAFASAPPDGERVRDLWQELLDKDDRTSPEEYPDHALITFDELADYVARATVSKAEMVQTHQADREAIARVIDPIAFSELQQLNEPSPEWASRQERALAKADAILALSPIPDGGDVQPPSPTFLAENAQNSLTAADAGEVRTYREGVERACDELDKFIAITRASPFWEERTSGCLDELAAAIRQLP